MVGAALGHGTRRIYDGSMTQDRPLIAVFQMVRHSIGGVQTVMAQVLPRLLDEFRVVVIDPYNDHHFAETMRSAGLEVVRLGSAPKHPYVGGKNTALRPLFLLRRAPWMALTLSRFRRWVRINRPAIVYFNQLQSARIFGRALPRNGPRLIYHAHGFVSSAEIGARTARMLSRRFAAVLPVSNITGRFLTDVGTDPAKIRVIYNGISPERIREEADGDGPPLPPKPAGGVVFVHVGTLNRHKKAQHLGIEALAQVPASVGARLWLCGDVPPGADPAYLEELHRLVDRLHLQDRVHFLGWRRDVHRVVKAADVLILPSLCPSESFGMAVLEAMAQGRPCIGSTVGGIPELIDHQVTGLVCEPTPEALGKAMRMLAESGEMRTSMGEAGRKRAENQFSLLRQVSEIKDALRACVAAR